MPSKQEACFLETRLGMFLLRRVSFSCSSVFLGVLGVCCCRGSLRCEQGPLSSCREWAPHCSDCSRCRAQVLGRSGFSSCGTWGSVLVAPGSRAPAQQLWRMGLVAPRYVGSSWIRDRICVSRITGDCSHWATREAQALSFKDWEFESGAWRGSSS